MYIRPCTRMYPVCNKCAFACAHGSEHVCTYVHTYLLLPVNLGTTRYITLSTRRSGRFDVIRPACAPARRRTVRCHYWPGINDQMRTFQTHFPSNPLEAAVIGSSSSSSSSSQKKMQRGFMQHRDQSCALPAFFTGWCCGAVVLVVAVLWVVGPDTHINMM